eukprot:5899675-Pleurochrysis_carterae.AAC.1
MPTLFIPCYLSLLYSASLGRWQLARGAHGRRPPPPRRRQPSLATLFLPPFVTRAAFAPLSGWLERCRDGAAADTRPS